MQQQPGENDISFLMRVGATARLCEFGMDKEFEEIVGTVAEQARNREVRTAALKLLSRKGTFTDLVDEVREIEAIRLNEEYFNMKHGSQTPVATIARVTGGEYRQQYRGRPAGVARGRYAAQQIHRDGAMQARNLTNWRGSTSSIPERCFRCNSLFHKANNCFAADKICRNCGVKGHLQRACRTFVRDRPIQQHSERVTDTKLSEISAVTAKEETKPEEPIEQENVPTTQAQDNVVSAITKVPGIRDDGVIRVVISGFPCDFLIDSGAQVNTLTEHSFNQLIDDESCRKGVHNLQFKADRSLKAYATSELHDDSRHLTNFMTEFGMFRCVRMPFGLCNAPDIFQEVMQRKILGGCKGVRNYLDDILIFGETIEEHDNNLAAVLERLEEHGVEINKSKVTSEDNVADALSRLIRCSQAAEPFEDENENHLLYVLDGGMDITLDEIEKKSETDTEMQKICLALRFDKWPRELRRYECQKKDLHNLGFLVFKNDTIVLPNALRKSFIFSPWGHVGEIAMKRIMRQFFWWPGMAKDTENFVKG
ncbi:uncharacterized protein K02A2.6-like [Armigeres subalbatus]|uniref:uncharacterized protein K02A2.6-like n=1 Tax=Armigeres subalbatus TaxID=124917 RepID=UPI002ED2D1BB